MPALGPVHPLGGFQRLRVIKPPHSPQALLDNSQSPYAQLLATSSLLRVVAEHTLRCAGGGCASVKSYPYVTCCGASWWPQRVLLWHILNGIWRYRLPTGFGVNTTLGGGQLA